MELNDNRYMQNEWPSIPESYPHSVFDDSPTWYLYLQRMAKYLNEIIDFSNDTKKYLNEFFEKFDSKVFDTLEDVLVAWKNDGRLQEILRVIYDPMILPYLDQLKNEVNEYQEDQKQIWTDFLNSVKDILESIDPNGEILSELVSARRPEGETDSYSSLGERLDNQIGLNTDFRLVEKNLSFMKRVSNEFTERAVNIKWYGAKGDKTTDDTQAFKDAIATLDHGDTLFIPKGSYLLTETLVINKAITMICDGTLYLNHDQLGLDFYPVNVYGEFNPKEDKGHHLTLKLKIDRNTTHMMTTTAVGVQIQNCFNGEFYLDDIRNNYTGVVFKASKLGNRYSAVTYCRIYIVTLKNYQENLKHIALENGYITQNQHYGGSFQMDANLSPDTAHVLLLNRGTSVINENVFFGCAFEGHTKKGIVAEKMNSGSFINCRFEMPDATHLFHFSKECRMNEFVNSHYIRELMRENKFYDNEDRSTSSSNTKVEYIDYSLGLITYYDRVYYITPNKNYNTSFGNAQNSVILSDIPSGWEEVRVVTNNMVENRINASATTVANARLSVDLRVSDKIYCVDYATFPFDEILFTKPPKNSRTITISILKSTTNPIPFKTDSTLAGIVDLTGNNSARPTGKKYTVIHYELQDNKIYILNHY